MSLLILSRTFHHQVKSAVSIPACGSPQGSLPNSPFSSHCTQLQHPGLCFLLRHFSHISCVHSGCPVPRTARDTCLVNISRVNEQTSQGRAVSRLEGEHVHGWQAWVTARRLPVRGEGQWGGGAGFPHEEIRSSALRCHRPLAHPNRLTQISDQSQYQALPRTQMLASPSRNSVREEGTDIPGLPRHFAQGPRLTPEVPTCCTPCIH